MLGSSACACGAAWRQVDMRDGLGPVWLVLHEGGRDRCRALPPPKPSEVLPGRTPLQWNPSVGTVYRHDRCGGECLVSDMLGNGQLELECDCHALPTELAHDFGIALFRLHRGELDYSARKVAERTLETNPDDETAKSVLEMLG